MVRPHKRHDIDDVIGGCALSVGCGYVLGAIAVNVLLVYVVIHFVLKFW